MRKLTLYDMLYLTVGAALLPVIMWRKQGRLPDGWELRWGRYPAETLAALERCRGGIWLHAVSLGEAKAAAPLVQALHERYPDMPLVLTAVTQTGYEQLRTLAGVADVVTYVPFDMSVLLERFLDMVQPRLVVLLEKELWPGMLRAVERRSVPIVLVNGRLSEQSAARYRWVRSWVQRWLGRIDRILVQSERDRERFLDVGALAERTTVVGNLKYDSPPVTEPQRQVAQHRRMALGVGPQEVVWICGSTHRDEEAEVVSVYRALRVRGVPLRLLLAPRHVERVPEVERIVRSAGLTPLRLSDIQGGKGQNTSHVARRTSRDGASTTYDLRPTTDVSRHAASDGSSGTNDERRTTKAQSAGLVLWILDTSGELSQWYGVADVAFVGGSLVPHGGQNLLEPAAWALPIVAGQHLTNFAAIAEEFERHQAIRVVRSENELATAVEQLARRAELRRQLGERAEALARSAAGATARVVAVLDDYLIRDAGHKTQDTRHKTQDTRHEIQKSDVESGGQERDGFDSRLASRASRLNLQSAVARWQAQLAWLLIPLSWVYGAAVWTVREGYRRRLLPQRRLSRAVVSVGNVTWGGTGKTPLVAWLAEMYVRRGYRVAVLTRGYRGCGTEGGDEAAMLREWLPSAVPVIAGRDRVRRGREAIARHDPDVLLLDDGFQHWRLHRDLDVVTVDARRPFGNGQLVPAGELRETARALGRADIIVITKSDQAEPGTLSALQAMVQRLNPRALVATARYRVAGLARLVGDSFVDADGASVALERVVQRGLRDAEHDASVAGRTSQVVDAAAHDLRSTTYDMRPDVPIGLVAGIADPSSFERTVSGLGLSIVWRRFFGDHHAYQCRDIEQVSLACRERGIRRVLTTEKDAVKLRRWRELLDDRGVEWWVVRVRLEIEEEHGALVDRLVACVDRSRR